MERTVKLLILGFAVFSVIATAGYVASEHQKARLVSLVAECKAEHLKPNPVAEKGPWIDFQMDPLICDPLDLFSASGSPVGVQKQIVETYSKRGWFDISLVIGGAFLVLLAAPYSWYFFLRRVREFTRALTSNS